MQPARFYRLVELLDDDSPAVDHCHRVRDFLVLARHVAISSENCNATICIAHQVLDLPVFRRNDNNSAFGNRVGQNRDEAVGATANLEAVGDIGQLGVQNDGEVRPRIRESHLQDVGWRDVDNNIGTAEPKPAQLVTRLSAVHAASDSAEHVLNQRGYVRGFIQRAQLGDGVIDGSESSGKGALHGLERQCSGTQSNRFV